MRQVREPVAKVKVYDRDNAKGKPYWKNEDAKKATGLPHQKKAVITKQDQYKSVETDEESWINIKEKRFKNEGFLRGDEKDG